MSIEAVGATSASTDVAATATIMEIVTDYQVAKKMIQLKQSADSRSLDFDLKFSTVKRLLNAKTCYYTGAKFTEEGPSARSIDRVDSSRGYVNDNVVACTIEINGKKNNLTIEDITIMYKKIKAFEDKKFHKVVKKVTDILSHES